jgi:hypothetical protein
MIASLQAVTAALRLADGNGNVWTVLDGSKKSAKAIEQNINEQGSQPRFHSGAMIS